MTEPMEHDHPARPADRGAGTERPRWQCAVIVVALILICENANFEFTMVSPGLPDIASSFQTAHVALVMTTVFVVSSVCLPIMGKLADIHGKKRILVVTSIVFAAGCALCALAPSFWQLLVGRALQSTFVIVYVVSYGLVRDLLPPRLVPLGVGTIGVGTGVSAVIGPVLGGFLIDNYGFRSVFWFLLCYDLTVAALVFLLVPESPVRIRHRLDLFGGALFGLSMGAFVFAAVNHQSAIISVFAGLALLALFIAVERRHPEPLISLPLLTRPSVWLTLVAAGMTAFCATGISSVLMPQMLRTPHVPGLADYGMGMSALQYGSSFGLVFGIVGAICGFLAGWASRRYSPRTALLVSIAALASGTALILTGWVTGPAPIAVTAALMGVGLGFLYAGANNLIIEAVPATVQGVSTSLLYTAMGVMNAVSTAVVGAITASHQVPLNWAGHHLTVVTADGFRIAYLVLLGGCIAALVIALIMRHGRAPATGGMPNVP